MVGVVVGAEVLVHEGPFGADSDSRVVGKQLLQEVDAWRVELGDDGGQVLLFPLGEGLLVVAHVLDLGPHLLGGRAEHLEDLEDLVDLRVAGEQGLALRHFGENAPDGPHVDARGVLLAAQEDLRRPVPERDHLVRVRPERHAERPGKPEVGDLQVPLLVDQQVLRLEVSVQHPVRVAVVDALHELHHELLHHVLAHALALWNRLHVLLEVHVEKLKHQVDLVRVRVHNVVERNDVVVSELLQQRDFSDRRRRDPLVLRLEPDLLESNYPVVVLRVDRLVHHSVRPLSNLL